MRHTFAGLLGGDEKPVRRHCTEFFFHPEEKPVVTCKWVVDEGVTAIRLDCPGSKLRYIVTRNMDDVRHKYPWRITRFDLETGEPYGHSYGQSAAEAMNKAIDGYEKCAVVSYQTLAGRQLGRAK